MSSRRSNIEIIADILRLGERGKTEIMFGCDLNYYQLQKYLDYLVARGLIKMDSYHRQHPRYRPTAKGKRILTHIDRVRNLLGLRDRDDYDDIFNPRPVKETSPALFAS